VRYQIALLSLILVGCSAAGHGGQTNAAGSVEPENEWLLGQWRIASENGSGPTLVIVMDSVTYSSIHGHVLRYMSGNSGRGPRDFKPFSAGFSPSGPIAVTVQWVDPNAPPISLVLERVGTGLELREFILGEDDMMSGGRSWVVTRLDR